MRERRFPAPLMDFVADPGDGDALAAVRLETRKVSAVDPVRAVDACGAPKVAPEGSYRPDAYTAGRDQTVISYRDPGQ